MVFSWKKAKKRAVVCMKKRMELYFKAGRNVEGNDLKHKLERLARKDA